MAEGSVRLVKISADLPATEVKVEGLTVRKADMPGAKPLAAILRHAVQGNSLS